MTNLKQLSKKKEKISPNDIMFMARMISLEFGGDFSNQEMANKIQEIFQIECTESDVENGLREYRLSEDYELENRKIMEYGSSIRY